MVRTIVLALLGFVALAGCAVDGSGTAGEPVSHDTSALITAGPFGCRGSHVALRASTGHYVVAEGGGGGAVNANRARIGPWETFTVHDVGGGKIALQASDGDFVCAEGGGGREVVANRPWLGPWEMFGLERHWNGYAWTLRASNGQLVVAEGGGGGVVNANRDYPGPWEAFEAVCLD